MPQLPTPGELCRDRWLTRRWCGHVARLWTPAAAWLDDDTGRQVCVDDAPAGTPLQVKEVRRVGPQTGDLRVVGSPAVTPRLWLVARAGHGLLRERNRVGGVTMAGVWPIWRSGQPAVGCRRTVKVIAGFAAATGTQSRRYCNRSEGHAHTSFFSSPVQHQCPPRLGTRCVHAASQSAGVCPRVVAAVMDADTNPVADDLPTAVRVGQDMEFELGHWSTSPLLAFTPRIVVTTCRCRRLWDRDVPTR